MKYFSSLKLKLIYVFRINDAEHKDCLKIGEATCDDESVIGLTPNSKPLNEAARKRISQYTQTAGIPLMRLLRAARKSTSLFLAMMKPQASRM